MCVHTPVTHLLTSKQKVQANKTNSHEGNLIADIPGDIPTSHHLREYTNTVGLNECLRMSSMSLELMAIEDV